MTENYKMGSGSVVTLPIGYKTQDGLFREVVIDKMRLSEKKALTSKNSADNPARAISDILARCILEITGAMPPKKNKMVKCAPRYVQEMFQPDRDYLLSRILIESGRGVLENYEFACEKCETSLVENVNLEEIDVQPHVTDDPTYIEYDLSYPFSIAKHVAGSNTFTKFDKLRLNYFKGKNYEKLSGKQNEGAYAIMCRLIQMEGTFIGKDSSGSLTSLTLDQNQLDQHFDPDDLDYLLEYMGDKIPGPNMVFTTTCPECGHEQEVAIDLNRFFLPKKRRSKKAKR